MKETVTGSPVSDLKLQQFCFADNKRLAYPQCSSDILQTTLAFAGLTRVLE
jgi:hypothetical protein